MVTLQRRISRSLATILFLSLLQVAAGPILAPQLSTPSAEAADANDFPTGLGTVYQFLAESYTSGSTTWAEARGGTAATITNNATKVTNTAGTLGASKSVVAVQGLTSTYLEFPTTVGPGVSSAYTLLYVARYAPISGSTSQAGNYCDTVTHSTSLAKSRIFTSYSGNWLSGFWSCAAGVAYHDGWLTQSSNSISELSGSNGNNWLLAADCGYTAVSSSTCKGTFRAFGTDRTSALSTSVATHQVVVNGGAYGSEKSDFQIAEVISYPTILQATDVIKIETYLARKYGIPLSSSSATKLGIHRASVGTNLNEPFATQPQIAIQDANGQTVTTDNVTVITATIAGANGKLIGTATATAIQGVATFDNLGVDGIRGTAYTITYSSNTSLTPTTEVRTLTRGGSSETDTAMTFNGTNQAVEVTDTTGSPLDLTGTFTIEAWVNPTGACAGGMAVLAKLSYMIYCSQAEWAFMALANGSTGSGVKTGIPIELNEWHHLAFTKTSSSGDVLFYYDGTLVKTIASGATTMTPNNEPLQIGRWASNAYWYQGEIDEVRIYNVQRNAAQIQNDMKSYADTNESSLAAYYDFNESAGSAVFNRKNGSSSTTDLLLTNAPTRTDVKTVDASTLAAYTILTFDRTYITSLGGWKAPSNITRASVLTVAGGGGGGARHSGGGGAGGVAYASSLPVTGGATYQISIGAGGIGYGRPGNNPFSGANGASTVTNDSGIGKNGENSIFRLAGSTESVTAIGGGANSTAGGSSGGTNSGTQYSSVPNKTQYSTSYFVGYGNNGGQGYNGTACGTDWCGGGGGGAGAPGGTPVSTGTTHAGDGGNGILLDISGISTYYAGGGGGGGFNAAQASIGGSGGGGAGGLNSEGLHAVDGTGGGGGGGGFNFGVSYRGGNGGSGIIIVRWITASKPLFTQPTGDTTTAGLTDTMTVSANPISPLTRNYQWQVSADTGTSWSNASTGSGATSYIYTTATLETTTSGARYQYRVIVTDSDTAGLFIVDTSTSVYLIINARITYSGTYTAQKYGATHQDTFTVTNGTGNKSFTYSPNNRSGITWSSPVTNSAVLTIATTLSPGTYLETITATDTKGAQTSLTLSILITKADTITVTALARSDTYTGSALTFTPSFTVVGLKNSDTVTPVSYNYAGSDNAGTAYGSSSSKPMNAGSYSITPVTPASLTDSYTAVVVETATLTINRATRTVTIGTKPTSMQFGSTSTLVATASAGGSDGTLSYSSLSTDTCTVSAANLQARKSSGTCSFTASITRGNNYESATAATATASLSKADTLTVTVNAITPLTYTGSPAAVSPTVTVAGLKLTNAVGSTPVTINYGSIGTLGSTCATGGTCAVGDTGPGGGKVFYVASSQQSWGRYLEAAPSNWSGGLDTSYRDKWCVANPSVDSTILGNLPDGIGQGYTNTYSLTQCTGGAIWTARTFNGGGLSDWYLPTGAELALMATSTNRVLLSLIEGTASGYWGYWGSNENGAGNIGSLVTSSWAIGATNKNELTHNYIRPIRAFSAGNAVSSFTTQIPTQVDTYTVQASALTLSSGSLSDYLGVTYIDGSLRINRAQQSPLSIAQFGAYLGTPYRIMIFGGSGTGALTETVTAGTATNCVISGDTLTASSAGTCQVFATKAQDRNYETATASAMVYFLLFVAAQPTPAPSSGPGIAITGATAITVSGGAPAITSVGASGDFTYPVAISGSGFSSDTAANTTIKFWRNALVSSPDFIIKSDGMIWSKQPFGATTGRILVTNSLGSAVSPEAFTPILMITI